MDVCFLLFRSNYFVVRSLRYIFIHVNHVAGSAGFAIIDDDVKDFSTTTFCECSLSRSNSLCDRHPLQHTVADYEIFLITDDVLFPNPLLGDIFAALGAILCHANKFFTESLVRDSGGPIEYLGCMGLFGTIYGLHSKQLVIFEREKCCHVFCGNDCSVVSSCLPKQRD